MIETLSMKCCLFGAQGKKRETKKSGSKASKIIKVTDENPGIRISKKMIYDYTTENDK